MPELPEVETVKRVLNQLVIGKKISNVEIKCDKMFKNIESDEFINTVSGQKITNIRRLGKYLFFDLETNTFVSHLRMEGKYNFFNQDFELTKHDHVIFYFDDDSCLMYNDTRKFGTFELVDYQKEQDLTSVNKLGLEPFDECLTVEYLKDKAKNKRLSIKQFLLDQTIITGLGNIYVDEVLFLAKIHPISSVSNLKTKDWQTIIEFSVKILSKSIEEGGTTVKSFSVSGDASGKFQHQLLVYGHKGEPCVFCQTPIEKCKIGGRGTHYCKVCQEIK